MASRRKLRSEELSEPEKMREREYIPRTPLAQRLWEIRQRIAKSGDPLLDWDDIEREVVERRDGSID
jgi:hypothetical protein